MKKRMASLFVASTLAIATPFAASAETSTLPDGIACNYIAGQLWMFETNENWAVNLSLTSNYRSEKSYGISTFLPGFSGGEAFIQSELDDIHSVLIACDASAQAKQKQ